MDSEVVLVPEKGRRESRGEGDRKILLLLTVFVIATCGLIYELVAGTLASYLLGDSVRQFSTIIGTYLFSMGIGSWLSRFLEGNLLKWFIRIEIIVGFVGGISAMLLFALFDHAASFGVLLYGFVCLTGILVGLEIPLLMRILKNNYAFKDLVSQVFTFDYIGALLASIIFPLLLIPHLGLIRTSLFFGLLNVAVAFFILIRFDETRAYRKSFFSAIGFFTLIMLAGFVYAEKLMTYTEAASFGDPVIFSKSTPYQRIVITRSNKDIRLYLNSNLQFSSLDEYRYHEALVHPAMQALPNAKHVLVMGGGDGLAIRELLKYPQIESITLVDLDPAMTRLFTENGILRNLNSGAFLSPKVKVVNTDAFNWVKSQKTNYDFIIADFPDPSNFSVGKLYTLSFYKEVHRLLSEKGLLVVQSTSPFVARKSFWCVAHTVAAAGMHVIPYHSYVPSFGEWGYVMASKTYNWNRYGVLPAGLRYINSETLKDITRFPADMSELATDTNRLNNQVLVHYFED